MLDDVVSEHGADVSITAVNRIRTGGVAGFFCREEYEVLVAQGDDADEPAPEPDERRRGRGRRGRGAMVDLRVGDDDPEFRSLLEEHLRDTEDTADLRGARGDTARAGAVARGGPAIPPTVDPDPAPAADPSPLTAGRPIIEAGLAPDPRPDLHVGLDAAGPATPIVIDDDGADTARPAVIVETEVEPKEEAAEPVPVIRVPARGPRSTSFWMRLYRLRRELDSHLPPTNDVTAVVGPLVHTMPVIRNLQCEAGLPADSVIVLTPRAEVVSEPSWRLVRSGQQMLEAIDERRDQPAVLAIDVDIELPVWVEPLLTRLRHHGLGVTRYLLDDVDQIDILLHHRGPSNGAFMIDIGRPLQPEDLVELVDRGLPIATVAGVTINAELLLAMRSHRLEGERLHDD